MATWLNKLNAILEIPRISRDRKPSGIVYSLHQRRFLDSPCFVWLFRNNVYFCRLKLTTWRLIWHQEVSASWSKQRYIYSTRNNRSILNGIAYDIICVRHILFVWTFTIILHHVFHTDDSVISKPLRYTASRSDKWNIPAFIWIF